MKGKKEVWIGLGILVILVLIIIGIKFFSTNGESIIESNYNRLNQLQSVYKQINKDIPIFSIMFGDADKTQLEDIANLTNAKVFDGRTNLLEAFKQVRGYN